MRLFVFGLGYTAQRIFDLYGGDIERMSGTVRSASKRDELRKHGIDAFLFNDADHFDGISLHIGEADALLVSVPPGLSGDPVLSRFGKQIANSAARSVVYLSTIGVYGDHGGAWINEDVLPSPTIDRARARLSSDADWKDTVGEKLAILRLAGIYGPKRNALTRLRDGTAKRIIKPGQIFNRIHVDDAAKATMAAIRHGRGGLWNVCDDEPAPPQDVISYAAALMKRPAPEDEDFDTAEMTPMARSFYSTSNRISNARMKQDLGVELEYPTYREGLQRLYNDGEGR